MFADDAVGFQAIQFGGGEVQDAGQDFAGVLAEGGGGPADGVGLGVFAEGGGGLPVAAEDGAVDFLPEATGEEVGFGGDEFVETAGDAGRHADGLEGGHGVVGGLGFGP